MTSSPCSAWANFAKTGEHDQARPIRATRRSRDQEPALTPTTLTVGTRLGPFEIAPRSARGASQPVVYRARDTRLDRHVAIKVLLPAVANDPERLARFEREAKVLASFNHPHIAAISGA